MKKQITGKTTITKSAPSRLTLKMFGGPLTIEQFRNNNNSYYVKMPDEKFNSHVVISESKRIDNYINTTDAQLEEKLKSIHNSVGVNDSLKLKRNKPLKRDQTANSLETTLGIRRTTKS